MNLFLISPNARRAARRHCDKHVVKMILEATQMLYAAWGDIRAPCPEGLEPYRRTHYNHPITKWVRADSKHYQFTCEFALHLCDEYTRRYGKIHACRARIERLQTKCPSFGPCLLCAPNGPNGPNGPKIAHTGLPRGIRWFPLAMPEHCFVRDQEGTLDAVRSYKRYYMHKRTQMTMKWNRKDTPKHD